MRTLLRVGAVAPALLALLSAPAALDAQARSAADPARPALIDILLRDIETVEDKLTRLVEAMPAAAYEFRPGEGVRSTGEVVMHIAADNYFLPTPAGIAAPDATGIQAGDYATVVAYEKRSATKAEAMRAMRESFAHLRAAMERTDDAFLTREIDLFGERTTGSELWVLTTVHLHEHLGQLIAYARSNGVVPPWSN